MPGWGELLGINRCPPFFFYQLPSYLSFFLFLPSSCFSPSLFPSSSISHPRLTQHCDQTLIVCYDKVNIAPTRHRNLHCKWRVPPNILDTRCVAFSPPYPLPIPNPIPLHTPPPLSLLHLIPFSLIPLPLTPPCLPNLIPSLSSPSSYPPPSFPLSPYYPPSPPPSLSHEANY